MLIEIRFRTENAAFADEPEAEIRRVMAEAARIAMVIHGASEDEAAPLRDSNGNTIGSVTVTP